MKFYKKILIIVLISISFIACGGNSSPQELRVELENTMEKSFKVMLPLATDKKIPDEVIKCLVKSISNTLSDEEVRLITDSSIVERTNNADKIMAIQQKLESPTFALSFLKQCS